MGLYDRDYTQYNDPQPRFGAGIENKPAWLIILVVTVVAYLVDAIFFSRGHQLNVLSAVHPDTLYKPWLWWQWVTYGLAHDPTNIQHVLFNMLGLFFFGSAVEQRLGRAEFARFYIASVFLGGLLWSVRLAITGGGGLLMGASGGVQAVTMLFVFMYPQATIYLMMVLPVKAWVAGVLFIGANLYGAISGAGNTAYDVHLVGIGFAALYYYQHWNLGFANPAAFSDWSKKLTMRRPKLRLHDPERKLLREEAEADRILQKIHEQGEASLTAAERKTLERYSRRMRQRGL